MGEPGMSDVRVTEGWAILSGNRTWDEAIYPTEEAARATALTCGVSAPRILKARRVRWLSLRPGNKITSLEDKLVLEEEA